MAASPGLTPAEVIYQNPGFGNLARVPAGVGTAICSNLGYRVRFIEYEEGSQNAPDVLLEPLQEGVKRYPPVRLIPKLLPRDINRLAP